MACIASLTAVWHLDMDELRAAFSDKTAVLLLNTPQNPTGKIFSRGELEQIAEILKEFPRALVISDEVRSMLLSLLLIEMPSVKSVSLQLQLFATVSYPAATSCVTPFCFSTASWFPLSLSTLLQVYEHMIYPGHEHTRMATLPGEWALPSLVCLSEALPLQ